MEEVKRLNSLDEIKAFSDPYRMQILNCIYRLGEPVTVKQIADDMREIPAKIHYHVKKLESVHILRLSYTREVNGIVAKYYEPTAKRFIIGRPELDPSNYKDVLNETQKLIIRAYNASQKIFLDNINEKGAINCEDSKGSLSMSSLYLTEKEYWDFKKYIEDFCERHGKKDNRENVNEYHFFSGIIRII